MRRPHLGAAHPSGAPGCTRSTLRYEAGLTIRQLCSETLVTSPADDEIRHDHCLDFERLARRSLDRRREDRRRGEFGAPAEICNGETLEFW